MIDLDAIKAAGLSSAEHSKRLLDAHDQLEAAALAQQMVPWTDAEITRFTKRVGLLARRGVPREEAERAADGLALRDQQRDDRRICLECANWQQSRTCFKQLPVSPRQLVRCPQFAWQQP